jgi:hypothetical protein
VAICKPALEEAAGIAVKLTADILHISDADAGIAGSGL